MSRTPVPDKLSEVEAGDICRYSNGELYVVLDLDHPSIGPRRMHMAPVNWGRRMSGRSAGFDYDKAWFNRDFTVVRKGRDIQLMEAARNIAFVKELIGLDEIHEMLMRVEV